MFVLGLCDNGALGTTRWDDRWFDLTTAMLSLFDGCAGRRALPPIPPHKHRPALGALLLLSVSLISSCRVGWGCVGVGAVVISCVPL